MRQVQISEELFSRLYGFHVLGKQDALQAQIICDQLQEKMDRIQARAEYSARVTPEQQRQRQQRRQERRA